MNCCQCHDHKFDPFTMRDFYSLGAFFADIQERPVGRQAPNLNLPTPEQTKKQAELEESIAAAKSKPLDRQAVESWTAALREKIRGAGNDWTVIRPQTVGSSGKATLKVQQDSSVLASGKNPNADIYTITLNADSSPVSALRLEALTHDSLTNKSLSRANGNFVLTGVELAIVGPGEAVQPLGIASAKADFEQSGWPIAGTIDGNPKSGWAVDGHNQVANRTAVFTLAEPVTLTDKQSLRVTLRHESDHAKHIIGRFRLSVTSSKDPTLSGGVDLPAELANVLKQDAESLDSAKRNIIEKHFRTLSPAWQPVREKIAAMEKQRDTIQNSLRTMLVSQSGTPRMVRILPRGNWLDDSGEIVSPNIPALFGSLEMSAEKRATRLDLAHWLVDGRNPLTARVFVNRMWKLLFGRGFVSLEDVGFQSDWPTHPELLNWLAADFVEHGWDVKRLIKQIVMSHTYRQSSAVSPDIRRRDPQNKWLARQGTFRLDAEMVRDNALAVSGLLVTDVGGAPVKPYQPAGYWRHLNFPARKWIADTGDNQHRRGLYTFWCRSFLHPSLQAFDAPSREECTAERPRSNTPLQALVLLNDPSYVEAANALAEKIATQPGDDSTRLDWAYQQVLQRSPSDAESAVLLGLISTQTEPTIEQWQPIARVLLNLHETITRE